MLDVYCRSFDWERAWYPIAPLRNLDASAPSRWELLGKSLVVWQSAPDATQPTEEDANEEFDGLDIDKDGKLSKEEFREAF